jgi:hypothetical protein
MNINEWILLEYLDMMATQASTAADPFRGQKHPAYRIIGSGRNLLVLVELQWGKMENSTLGMLKQRLSAGSG